MTIQRNCSIVIPVYNGAETLGELLERLAFVLPDLCQQYEAVLVNDGSQDESWQVIQELAEQYHWVHGINLMRNYGQHNALLCGIRAARFEIIVTMDDDLQHPPEEIHKLLAKLDEGYDVVYGTPAHLPHSWWRNLYSLLTRRVLAHLIGAKILEVFEPFRAFQSHLRTAFEKYQNPNVQLDVLLSWGANRFSTINVEMDPRKVGQSNYNFYRLLTYALIVVTSFSTLPLRFTSILGFLFTFFGILVFVYIIWIYFYYGSTPGFPFLASIIAIFSGTQLFALGIIGEYLARVFDRSLDRPAYVIQESLQLPASLEEYEEIKI
jgi:glycosyltransferase involved in cell wall biosynthesis